LHQAEVSIRDDIHNLTIYRVAPRVIDIKRDIKYAFWHGFINEYIYKELQEKLQEKHNSLFEQTY
jgi:hypothetical protein